MLLTLLLLLASTLHGATFYISKTLGVDSRTSAQAQNKETPWAHLPGMGGCTTGCTSNKPGNYTPQAGDSFILRGGETWGRTDLGVNWKWSGTAILPIYIGVDATWYAGGSWTRPILSCAVESGNYGCQYQTGYYNDQYAMFHIYASHDVILDNIEFTGQYKDATHDQSNGVMVEGSRNEIKNNYFHGWTRHASSTHDNGTWCISVVNSVDYTGTLIHHNLIDGFDTSKDMMSGISSGYYVYNNTVRYVVGAIQEFIFSIHDNLVEHIVGSYESGAHPDLIYHKPVKYGDTTHFVIYNNVLRLDDSAGGGENWYTTTSCPGCSTYIFNNVIYGQKPAWAIGSGWYGAGVNYGTFYIFNNTVGTNPNASHFTGMEGAAQTTVTHYMNNHAALPAPTANYECDSEGGVTCNDGGGNIFRTPAQMTSDNYTSSSTYAFQPMSAGGVTVNQGSNQSALCSTIAGIDADAGAACLKDTTYGGTRTAVTRGATWDAGAYEYTPPPAGAAHRGGTDRGTTRR